MGHVARLLLVSKEFAIEDLKLLRQRLPSEKDFQFFVVWEYDDNNIDSKWTNFESSAISLKQYITEEEDR